MPLGSVRGWDFAASLSAVAPGRCGGIAVIPLLTSVFRVQHDARHTAGAQQVLA